MSYNDHISDLLVRLRNAQMAGHEETEVPSSKIVKAVLDVMCREGFIAGVEEEERRSGVRMLRVGLRYSGGRPVIVSLHRVSKPGRRIYAGKKTLPSYYNGLGVSILSTSKGVVAAHEAKELGVGGEVLCQIF